MRYTVLLCYAGDPTCPRSERRIAEIVEAEKKKSN
jgi:hypothetical protein